MAFVNTLQMSYFNSSQNVAHVTKRKREVLEINTLDGRIQCRNTVLSSGLLKNFSHNYSSPCRAVLQTPQSSKSNRICDAYFYKSLLLKRLARHKSIEQPSFRLINVFKIIFHTLIAS